MGSIHRGIALKRNFEVSYPDYVAANLFFIWTDTLLNFVIAFLLFTVGTTELQLFGVSAGTSLALSSIALVLAPLVAQRLLGPIRNPANIVRKLAEVADELTRGLHDLRCMVVPPSSRLRRFFS